MAVFQTWLLCHSSTIDRKSTRLNSSPTRRSSDLRHPSLAQRPGTDLVDGPLCRLLEDAWPYFRPGFCVIRALSVRALRHHVEDFVHRTSVDEAHPAGVERRRCPQGSSAHGDREPSGCRAYRADDYDFRGHLARRQRWLLLRGRRRGVLSLADSAARHSEDLSGLVLVVEFCFG